MRRGSERSLVGIWQPAKVICPFSIDFFTAGQDNLQDVSLKEWKTVPYICGKLWLGLNTRFCTLQKQVVLILTKADDVSVCKNSQTSRADVMEL